ncbi:MAG: GNAT family N-acetyltransferase [Anaerolineae bacterium]|nr:GNAT family N-acetyltransferase [Anaerolineae bacterium]
MDENKLEIVKLSPDRLDDYLNFFENVAHTDNKEWARCYCLNYCSVNNSEEAKTIFFDPDVRREYAIQYVTGSILQGYLAYRNGQVVGWCNSNERNRCLDCFGSFFIYGDGKPSMDIKRVKSVFCFAIAPSMRGKHIATALLERVIMDAHQDGYEFIEAYPQKKDVDIYYSYSGHIGMYTKLGFTQCGETQNRFIMRKKVN